MHSGSLLAFTAVATFFCPLLALKQVTVQADGLKYEYASSILFKTQKFHP